MKNTLYYGDNLAIMQEHIADESVHLVYLDPPFNSSRTYNLLFKQRKGDDSPAQIMAFEDTWTWSPILYEEFMQDIRNVKLFELMESLFKILGKSEMMAYVLMMAPRLLELRRVLKRTGSLYLHCDPVASHYLKIILDVIFGPSTFRNEITWKRHTAHSDATRKFSNVADVILFYAASQETPFNPIYTEHNPEYLATFYKYDDGDGRGRYSLDNMAAPAGGGMAAINKTSGLPNGWHVYKGFNPPQRGWRYSPETMAKLDGEGRVHFPKYSNGSLDYTKRLRLKRYLSEQEGSIITNVWADILPVQSHSPERTGYQTQKPLALLERVVYASSNEGEIVLDPFCGCGTAIVAADRLKRRWIGIDVTYLAIAEIEYRLARETHAKPRVTYTVEGSPKDRYAAHKFFEQTAPQNHKPFEMWAVSLVQGEPIEKKGGDKGIDGRIPVYDPQGKLQWAVIQVKGGHLSPTLIRDFAHVIGREKAIFGLFICLHSPTKQMLQEAEELGVVSGYGVRQIQRLQILTVEDLLEHGKRFDIPLGYRPLDRKGIGKVAHQTQPMDFNEPTDDEDG